MTDILNITIKRKNIYVENGEFGYDYELNLDKRLFKGKFKKTYSIEDEKVWEIIINGEELEMLFEQIPLYKNSPMPKIGGEQVENNVGEFERILDPVAYIVKSCMAHCGFKGKINRTPGEKTRKIICPDCGNSHSIKFTKDGRVKYKNLD